MAAIGRTSSVGESHRQREPRRYRMLTYAACFFAAALVIHGADHLRRGLTVLTPQVLWGGSLLSVAGLATVLLVLRGHRLAPLLAVVVGFSTALGVVASHLLPRWSALSDSFVSGGAELMSWVVVLAEIVGAFAFGVAGATLTAFESDTGSVSVIRDSSLKPPKVAALRAPHPLRRAAVPTLPMEAA